VFLDEPIPDEYEENWEKLKALHPTWGFESWERSEDLELRNRELFDSFTDFPAAYGFRADIARYELLAKFGGCYVDTDVEPLRPFDSLPEDVPFVAWCSEKELDPAVIGSPAHHPAIELLVDDLAEVHKWRKTGKKMTPPGSTGPTYITSRWRRRDDVLRLPPIVFFPYHWSGKPYSPWPRESLAVHRWRSGWKTPRRRIGATP
jgi:mannosyltransferase OCH1-like enzyme